MGMKRAGMGWMDMGQVKPHTHHCPCCHAVMTFHAHTHQTHTHSNRGRCSAVPTNLFQGRTSCTQYNHTN